MAQIDAEPGSIEEQDGFQLILQVLMERIHPAYIGKRVGYFLQYLKDDNGLAQRFLAYTKEGKANKGNVNASGAINNEIEDNNDVAQMIFDLGVDKKFWVSEKPIIDDASNTNGTCKYTARTKVEPSTGMEYPLFPIAYETIKNRFKARVDPKDANYIRMNLAPGGWLLRSVKNNRKAIIH
jgi:hypothetical protein